MVSSTQQNGGNNMTMAPVDKDTETCFFCREIATQDQGTAYLEPNYQLVNGVVFQYVYDAYLTKKD